MKRNVFYLLLIVCNCIRGIVIGRQHSQHGNYVIKRKAENQYPILNGMAMKKMGPFKCFGWGPGCLVPTRRPGSGVASGNEVQSRGGIEAPSPLNWQTFGRQRTVEFAPSKTIDHVRRVPSPLFSLTSGDSWNPTGRRKRNADRDRTKRKASTDQKRIDFLKRIIQDMMEDNDSEVRRPSFAQRQNRHKKIVPPSGYPEVGKHYYNFAPHSIIRTTYPTHFYDFDDELEKDNDWDYGLGVENDRLDEYETFLFKDDLTK